MLSNFTLRSSCPNEAFDYWDFFFRRKTTPQLKKNLQILSWTIPEHHRDSSILLGTWAHKTSATLSNSVRKILASWTKAATLFTCQLLRAINWQVWSLGLTFSAKSTMLVRQIAASISDFLRVSTELLNFIIASYHQKLKSQLIFGYRLPVVHSFALPLEIELLQCNLGQVIP